LNTIDMPLNVSISLKAIIFKSTAIHIVFA